MNVNEAIKFFEGSGLPSQFKREIGEIILDAMREEGFNKHSEHTYNTAPHYRDMARRLMEGKL